MGMGLLAQSNIEYNMNIMLKYIPTIEASLGDRVYRSKILGI